MKNASEILLLPLFIAECLGVPVTAQGFGFLTQTINVLLPQVTMLKEFYLGISLFCSGYAGYGWYYLGNGKDFSLFTKIMLGRLLLLFNT